MMTAIQWKYFILFHCLLMISARPNSNFGFEDSKENSVPKHLFEKPSDYLLFASHFQLTSDFIPSQEDKFYMCTGPCSENENCQDTVEEKIKESAIDTLVTDALIKEDIMKRRKRQNNHSSVNNDGLCSDVPLYLYCRGPCINELPKANCSPDRKRLKVEEGGNGCDGESSTSESTQPDQCKDGNGADETNLAMDTEAESHTTETSKECYFKHERVNPNGLEKNERPPQSKVSSGCCPSLQRYCLYPKYPK
jgi:hypothetical protein